MASVQYMKINSTESEKNLTSLLQKKLKRKNGLSVSQTSFNDIVNQEKRTKMETIEKLMDQNKENVSQAEKKSNIRKDINGCKITVDKKVLTKPPLPPSRLIHKNFTSPVNNLTPAIKKKLGENSLVLQKLNAQIDQIRLKNVDLKASLGSERSALRTLRAQQEADIQKWKTKVKKLQTILEATKKLASINGTQNSKDEITNGHEKFKDDDLRKLNDSYVIRLNRLSKSAKTEICRLLEELKKKERYIGILRKELQIQNDNKSTTPQKRTNSKIVQDPIEMKKLKDIEQRNKLKQNEINANKKINNCYINSTCDEKDFDSMSHEITERILNDHNDHHDECKSNDYQNSDCDSALSSISPQPPAEDSDTQANIWKTLNNYSKDLKNLRKENDIVRLENINLRNELDIAKQKIEEFALLENNINNADKIQQLLEKIKFLQSKESNLEQELHDIREQNELLEFRIIEVEESNDKWSLQSNPMFGFKNVCSDIEEECDDITMINDRSDSGVFSPNNNKLLEEFGFSHCNNSKFSNINKNELNQGLADIFQKSSIDNKDRLCLQQAIKLIQSLDIMSQTNSNLDLTKSNTFEVKSSLQSTDYSNNPLQKLKLSSARVVATVSPYNSYCSSTSSDCSRKACISLSESGIFDESSELQCRFSKYTQTNLEDFGSATENPATKDLCAEIQRLNKFREKIEECVNKSGSTNNISSNVTGGPTNISQNLTDQKRLQYYEERVEVLEGKLLIYESSGDIQIKRLATRLQKEVQLENTVKDLREQLDLLIIKKNYLEEEKCEFEEAENDTRLRLQRLEVDLEILNQRNIELEMSRDSVQNKLKESQSQCAGLHEELIDCHEKVEVYKEQNNELNTSMKFLKKSLPALVLLNAFMVVGGNQCGSSDSKQSDSNKCNEKNSANSSLQVCNNNCNKNCTNNELIVANLQKELHQIRCREQDLRKTITMLEGAYQETIENADCFWAQIEKSYEKQLAEAEAKENCLKSKVNQLEERLKCDESAAHEKISQLEETESELRCLLSKITKENRDLCCELNSLRKELKCMQEALQNTEKASDGPKELLEIEKKKGEALLEEVRYIKKLFCDAERHHNEDIKEVKCELIRASKELQQLEITNAELKEEVGCFENQIKKMDIIRKEDSDKIRCLQDELADKIEQCAKIQKRLSAKSSANSPCAFSANKCSQQSLAQELNGSSESPSKKLKRTEVKDLPTAAEMLGQTLEFTKNVPDAPKFIVTDITRN